MFRFPVAILIFMALTAWPLAANAQSQNAGCVFVLGFQTLHDLIPAVVGGCLDNESHNPSNGDALQHTTNGLLVWRKADNFTAFTDGYRTWVNGPFGVQERLNSQRFPWEAGGQTAPTPAGAQAQLRHYYDLINQRDYAEAYDLLLSHPQTYAQFVQGYQDTTHVDIAVGQPEGNNAAGHLGFDIPTVLLAHHTDGSLHGFAGCYTLTTPNPGVLPPGTPSQPWKIVNAEIQPLAGITSLADPAAQAALAGPCPGHAGA